MADPDLASLQEAARKLEGITWQTPMQVSNALDEIAGAPVYLKCENLQRTGSFKLRGAYLRLCRLSPEEKKRGVVAASAGNHAQGVALAARLLGISALVYMPTDAALPKLAATRGYGAQIEQVGATIAECIAAAEEDAERSGRIFVHPFEHLDIITGQGTLGLEISAEVPDAATVIVPTGGGGLISGIARALRLSGSRARIIGVQAAGAASFPASLAAGEPVANTEVATMADGIAVPRPGELTLEMVSADVDEIRTVSEESLARAILLLSERAKLVVEAAGAAGVAAVMDSEEPIDGPIVVVLSGGNIDTLVLDRLLRHGLVSAGRYLQMSVRVPDQPGSLAALLSLLANTGGNVVSVEHTRTGVGLRVGEVEIGVELETKGVEHCHEVLGELRRRGYKLSASTIAAADPLSETAS